MDGISVFQEMPETRAMHTSNLRLFVFEIINNMAIYNDESRVMEHNSTVFLYVKTVLVQLSSCVRLFVTPWTAARQVSLSLTISQSLPKFMSILLVMPSSHLIFWCFLLLPSIFPSIREFSSKSAVRIRWSKYWSFSFSISPSNEYLGLISLKIDWFGLLAVQGTLRSFLQHHSSKASILWRSTFFTVQLYWEPWIKVMLGKELPQLQKYLVATLLILEILLLPVSLYFFKVLNIVKKGFK